MQNQPVIPDGKFECPIQVAHVIYAYSYRLAIAFKALYTDRICK